MVLSPFRRRFPQSLSLFPPFVFYNNTHPPPPLPLLICSATLIRVSFLPTASDLHPLSQLPTFSTCLLNEIYTSCPGFPPSRSSSPPLPPLLPPAPSHTSAPLLPPPRCHPSTAPSPPSTAARRKATRMIACPPPPPLLQVSPETPLLIPNLISIPYTPSPSPSSKSSLAALDPARRSSQRKGLGSADNGAPLGDTERRRKVLERRGEGRLARGARGGVLERGEVGRKR